MSSPLLAEIKMFGGTFPPRGYAFCDGSILSIAQNTALFSLLGTTYGGNGQTTFALPDLRGRSPVHAGASTGPGLSPMTLGQSGGAEAATLTINNLPAHSHANNISVALPCHTGAGNLDNPGGAIPAGSATNEDFASPASANGTMSPLAINTPTGITGGSVPFGIRPPYLAINFIIALEGIYPARN